MEDFRRMAIFAAVVQQGSMSAAARQLDMTPSAVSQHIRQLEKEADISLLHRSTRQLSLTDAGQRFYVQCAAMCEAADRASAELAAERQQPSGELRLSAPAGFTQHAVPALGDWLRQHPALRLRLLMDDTPIDLIQARVDLALRFGHLPDSSWIARPLGRSPTVLCAAPSLLARLNALPQHPRDLADLPWLDMSRSEPPQINALWQHSPSGESFQLQATPQMSSNHRAAVQQFCEAGLGLALLSAHDVTSSLRQGRLLRLLPQWDMGQLDIWAVTAQREALSAKVRQAIEVLRQYFAKLEGMQQSL
ncbi:MAG: LysR family transcriptional regulator [Comamonas sp.]|jgi:DNA-binding transcriptional LysR family regulator|uniref:LysR family transcriptional regulator n=1 Tax=Comamonas sp. TaxID=34028 RepID=UPI002823C4B9|nr:LysR substrate-binding domain-containing protein [Comamonas sp.]MDR0217034.1 LysR family transcriptional regulator [Comamonas sp.]